MDLEAKKGKITVFFNIWPLSVTLTFEIRLWFFNSIHWLEMMNISARLFKNPFMRIWATESTRKWGGQTDHLNEKGNNRQYFHDFICSVHNFKHKMSLSYSSEVPFLYEMSVKLDLAVLTVFPEFVAIFLYSWAHNSHQN